MYVTQSFEFLIMVAAKPHISASGSSKEKSRLKPHLDAIDKALGDDQVLNSLLKRYPELASVSVSIGKSFGMHFDPEKKNLGVTVNISSPKVTGRDFRNRFSKKGKGEKPGQEDKGGFSIVACTSPWRLKPKIVAQSVP